MRRRSPIRTPPVRWLLLGAAAGLWLLAALVKGIARPWLGAHGPSWQAPWLTAWLVPALGAAPSLLAGLSLPLCFLALQVRPDAGDRRRAYLSAVVIVLVAELIELALPGSTFDWLDVAASLVGVGAAALLGRLDSRGPAAQLGGPP